MPVISMAMAETDKSKKEELIKRLSTAASEVTNLPLDAFTVLISEYESDNIGLGGKTLSDVMASR